MTTVPRLNAATPFLEGVPNSMVSKEWYRVIFSIAQILGGGAAVTPLGSFQDAIETQRRPLDSVSSYYELLDRLLLLEAFARHTISSLRNRLEAKNGDIEALLVSHRVPPLGTLTNANFSDSEIPNGVIDGANAVFTLKNVPVSGSVHLYLNGIRQRLTTDFSVSGKTITYTAGAKPQAGDNHVADYRQ